MRDLAAGNMALNLTHAHLMHAPYQPYQLLNIPYADAPFIKTAGEAVAEARKARGAQDGSGEMEACRLGER